ncbi:MAG: acetoacetate decarboxylase family protein [Acidobacteriaceae bacterium]
MSFVKTPQELLELGQMKIDFFEAEMIFAFWLTRPELVERLLPPPLKPTDIPLASAFIANYPRTSFGLPYKEAALFLAAQYEQVQGSYCLAMPVTDDMAMAGGREQFGFPKKMAQIELIRKGEKFHGYAERKGVRFFELEFTKDEQSVADIFKNSIQQSLAFHQEPGSCSYLIKSFLAPDDQIFDYSPRLIRQNTAFRPKTIEWGQAQIKFERSNSDPWYEVEVINLIGAMRIVGNNTMHSGHVLTEISKMEYAPYAFIKWDM